MKQLKKTLEKTFTVIEARRYADASNSYVATLFKKGRKKIAQKVGEEGCEVAMAAVLDDKQEMIAESADLIFHLLVLWQHADITPDEIAEELERRQGISGIDEKKARKDSA